jgi:hypothetical protein
MDEGDAARHAGSFFRAMRQRRRRSPVRLCRQALPTVAVDPFTGALTSTRTIVTYSVT